MAEKSLEVRIERMEALNAVQNLMGRYEYLLTAAKFDDVAELFAKKTPGTRAEMMWGVYEGYESVKRLYTVAHKYFVGDRIGCMYEHDLTTPVIEVAGDGKTAKGVWISPGHETIVVDSKPHAHWAWCKYAVDFAKEDRIWKFWHFHIYGIFLTPYEASWVEAGHPDASPDMPDELKADKPPTTHWMYNPTAVTELVPAPPVPYETFNESTAY